MRENEVMQHRLLRAYCMMLAFYGLELQCKTSGQVKRAPNWKTRLAHLNSHSHNFLRITRILRCLGELGYERLQAPLVKQLITEAFINNTLSNARTSCRDYWIAAVVSEHSQLELNRFLDETMKRTTPRSRIHGDIKSQGH
jgi:hypothetical protein